MVCLTRFRFLFSISLDPEGKVHQASRPVEAAAVDASSATATAATTAAATAWLASAATDAAASDAVQHAGSPRNMPWIGPSVAKDAEKIFNTMHAGPLSKCSVWGALS